MNQTFYINNVRLINFEIEPCYYMRSFFFNQFIFAVNNIPIKVRQCVSPENQ